MEITLYLGTTINGYIGKEDGNSDWVSDADYPTFEQEIKNHGVVIMGRKTAEVNKEFLPFEKALNVVLTKDKSVYKDTENIIYKDNDLETLLKDLEDKGYSKAIVIGGQQISTLFLENNLIDNIIISIHPLVFGKGLSMFLPISIEKELELVDVKKLKQDLVQLKYKVLE